MNNVVVTFGEIMGRLAAPEFLRLRQTRELEVTYAGAEASVAASICNFGGSARYVTALPKHALADATMDSVRAVGVDTRYILRTDKGRLGLYFLETGANQRPSNVIYDRADSAIAITPADKYDWAGIFDGAQWLHLSGITPALSANAAEATRLAAQKAKAAGAKVSIDLNFRGKLWKWDATKSSRELAQATMKTILPTWPARSGSNFPTSARWPSRCAKVIPRPTTTGARCFTMPRGIGRALRRSMGREIIGHTKSGTLSTGWGEGMRLPVA
jgi:2-dehydro-3-deoxygluconokinase